MKHIITAVAAAVLTVTMFALPASADWRKYHKAPEASAWVIGNAATKSWGNYTPSISVVETETSMTTHDGWPKFAMFSTKTDARTGGVIRGENRVVVISGAGSASGGNADASRGPGVSTAASSGAVAVSAGKGDRVTIIHDVRSQTETFGLDSKHIKAVGSEATSSAHAKVKAVDAGRKSSTASAGTVVVSTARN